MEKGAHFSCPHILGYSGGYPNNVNRQSVPVHHETVLVVPVLVCYVKIPKQKFSFTQYLEWVKTPTAQAKLALN